MLAVCTGDSCCGGGSRALLARPLMASWLLAVDARFKTCDRYPTRCTGRMVARLIEVLLLLDHAQQWRTRKKRHTLCSVAARGAANWQLQLATGTAPFVATSFVGSRPTP